MPGNIEATPLIKLSPVFTVGFKCFEETERKEQETSFCSLSMFSLSLFVAVPWMSYTLVGAMPRSKHMALG